MLLEYSDQHGQIQTMVHLDRKEVNVNSARLTNRGVAYYKAWN
jgi:hypothetical protein